LELNDWDAIKTTADTTAGGNIYIEANTITLIDNSPLSATVYGGAGGGGNINIQTANLVALENSDITANAVFGDGGNIQLKTQSYFHSADSKITASSEFGLDGVVKIDSPFSDLSGSLGVLSSAYLQEGVLVTDPCTAKKRGERSSFYSVGQGGLPATPNDYLRVVDHYCKGNKKAR